MHFSIIATALLSATYAAATDHVVQVGANNALVFNPSNITAVEGDTISFQFVSKNHSVTQSTFASPCVRQTTPTEGVDSGFMFINSTTGPFPQWQISVTNATTPLWFFCAQTNPKPHCELGMVFSVNAPATKTFTQFQAAAMAATPDNSTTGNTTSSTGTSNGTTTTNGTTAGSVSTPGSGSASAGSGTPAAPPSNSTGSANSGALKLGGSAAGVMTAAALFVTFVL